MIDVLLSHKVYEKSKETSTPLVVAISGAADLGKSYLSQEIIKHLETRGISASHLTLDSFLIERRLRKEKNLSGYQIESYNLQAPAKCLLSFKSSQAFSYLPYNHLTGKSEGKTVTIKNSQVLIFDGLHTLHESFIEFINLSIFIDTSDSQLKNIRLESDLTKRGLSLQESQLNSEPELIQYKNNVEPYKTKSFVQVYLKEKWVYEVKAGL